MPYGLKDIELAKLNEVFAANERIERVVLYGSRAKGNYKPFSDVDITLEGDELTHTDLSRLSLAIDDLLLPYQFDISIFHTLKNEALIDHIRRMGITIYEKESEWKEYKLGEIIQLIGGGTPKTSVPEYWDGDIPWLSVSDFNNGKKYVFTTEKHITQLGLNNSSTKLLHKDDIIISARGTVGVVAMIGSDMAFNQSCYGIRNKDLVDKQYLYYLLVNSVNGLKQNAYGGVFDTITRETFDLIDVSLPSLDEQRRIAAILSSLDDKIDLLHRENATLEQMAETLFRQWFVVETKEEWEEGTIIDFAKHCKDSINPQKHPNTVFQHYSIPAFDDGKKPTAETGENIQSNKYLVPSNCILFSKLNPHKDKRVWLMLDDVPDNAICSTEFQIVKPSNPEYLYFLYGWLTNKENYDEIASGVGGTSGSHQRIDPKSIFSFSCPNVDIETIRKYNNKVEPLFYKIRNNQKQIQTLIQMRDGLLPKLMGGEIKIL